MSKEYLVTVMSKIRQEYTVMAESEEEARDKMMGGEPCDAVLGVEDFYDFIEVLGVELNE